MLPIQRYMAYRGSANFFLADMLPLNQKRVWPEFRLRQLYVSKMLGEPKKMFLGPDYRTADPAAIAFDTPNPVPVLASGSLTQSIVSEVISLVIE